MVNSNALTAAFFTLRIRNVHLWSATWWCQHLLMLLLLLTALERQRRVHQTPRRTMTFLELKPRAPPRVHSWLLLVEILERRVMQQLRDPALQQLLMASVEDPAADGHAKYWPAKCCELTSSWPVLGTQPNTLRSSTGAPCSRVPSKQICLPGTGKLKWAECITAPLPAMIDSSLQASTIAVGATLPPASK